MLPKGHQTLLFLREMQTVLITNRPRSSLFSTRTGVSFALPTTHTKKKKRASSVSQCTSPLWCPVSIISWNSEMRGFGLYCDSQSKIRRSKPRGWRGNGTLCRSCCSGEAQPFFESWFKDVNCDSSWLLTAVSHHKPTQHQREKDEQESGSLNVGIAMVLALVLISLLCAVSKPGLTHDSQNEWRKWNMTQCYFLGVSI